ncbi:ABC transporter substrate-binding protein [Pseudoroseicyclus tamaricis]|uniref:ABC transporter substrate-binding protein n=1 Tax=Pseudoroseicyclus tamaricis TaxID=2705421 RepID=A0A6B2JV41_9RHOB|nr:ABC transporter substrate-binding protein [Pseudoroseicyclus tamaricis]NDV02377.1 ABC transporter substrate-binding protein [Pseudoroseicyclus tamaricis]
MRSIALALALLPASAGAQDLLDLSWEEVVEEARGGEVNFFLWGGADNINRYVSEYLGGLLKPYEITLNRVGVADTTEAVNLVLGEKAAGNDNEGAVDLIWINGENFRTMMEADLAYCGYTDLLPNAEYVDWQSPAIAYDFGLATEGCEVPWSGAQFAFAYDSARMDEPPRSIEAILDFARENPGQFTYPAPPDFNGAAFVRHVFYEVAGGPDRLLGDFDQQVFDEVAGETWELLNELEPSLWREGATYPTSITQLQQLFANGEVALSFEYNPSQFGAGVEAGQFPETVRSYGLDGGTLANTNYTLIPYNAANKAAALVLQNLILSPEAQLEKARPEVWGAASVLVEDRLPSDVQESFAALPSHPSVVSPAELAGAALPELSADWIAAIEAGWIETVGTR